MAHFYVLEKDGKGGFPASYVCLPEGTFKGKREMFMNSNLVGKVLSTMKFTVSSLTFARSIPGRKNHLKNWPLKKKSGIATCSRDHSTAVGSFTVFTSVV